MGLITNKRLCTYWNSLLKSLISDGLVEICKEYLVSTHLFKIHLAFLHYKYKQLVKSLDFYLFH